MEEVWPEVNTEQSDQMFVFLQLGHEILVCYTVSSVKLANFA